MTWWLDRILRIGRLNSGLTYVTSANFVTSVILALFWFLLASLLATEDYGRLNYFISIAAVLSVISLLGLNTTVTTYLAKGNQRLVYQANLIVLISNSVIFIILLLLTKFLPVGLLLLGLSFFTMSMADFLGRKSYRGYFFLVVIERAVQIALSLSLYYFIGIDGVLIGYAVAAIAFSYRFFRTFGSFSSRISELKDKFAFTKYAYPMNVVAVLGLHVDKLIIGPLFGFDVLGLYQLGFQALIFVSVIPISLYEYLLPQESSGIERRKTRLGAFIMSIIVALVFIMISPFVIQEFFPKYVEAIGVTQILILAIIPMTVSSIIRARLLGNERSKPVLIGAIIYMGTLAPMLYLLGNFLGLTGLGISVVVSLSLQSVSLVVMNSKLSADKANSSRSTRTYPDGVP